MKQVKVGNFILTTPRSMPGDLRQLLIRVLKAQKYTQTLLRTVLGKQQVIMLKKPLKVIKQELLTRIKRVGDSTQFQVCRAQATILLLLSLHNRMNMSFKIPFGLNSLLLQNNYKFQKKKISLFSLLTSTQERSQQKGLLFSKETLQRSLLSSSVSSIVSHHCSKIYRLG